MRKYVFFEKGEFNPMFEIWYFKDVLLRNLTDKENLTYKQQKYYINKITKKQVDTIANRPF